MELSVAWRLRRPCSSSWCSCGGMTRATPRATREAFQRLVVLALPVSVVVTGTFTLAPGLARRLFRPPPIGRSGFDFGADMRPGDLSSIALSYDVAFRVRFPSGLIPAHERLYWRGSVYTKSEGLTWKVGRGTRGDSSDGDPLPLPGCHCARRCGASGDRGGAPAAASRFRPRCTARGPRTFPSARWERWKAKTDHPPRLPPCLHGLSDAIRSSSCVFQVESCCLHPRTPRAVWSRGSIPLIPQRRNLMRSSPPSAAPFSCFRFHCRWN